MNHVEPVKVIGGGLAGCEVALQLARRGVPVRLYEMKPQRRTPAQQSDALAELVCSNSFRSAHVANAIGLLKWEMRAVGSAIMAAADKHAVPAGDALAVDREAFAAEVTAAIDAEPGIERVAEVVERIPEGLTVIATGPLTDPALAAEIAARAGRESLYFYDAIAPIVDADSIDWHVVWRQSRYDKGEGADYANVPLDEAEYHAFIAAVLAGEQVRAHGFEEARYFEGCLPIEVMAERGPMTLAFGPLKPVGLTDPRTGKQPFAVVQLRMENREATAWNLVGFQTRLKYPEQKRIFRTLPGLARAEFLRFGSVHRNTYLHAPTLLADALHWHDDPDLYFAGQITGVEGYVESTACGLLIAWHVLARLRGLPPPVPPPTTAFGALRRHLRGEGILSDYSPSNLNWSLFAPIDRRRREPKRDQRMRAATRAQAALTEWWQALAPTL
ncbi:MAG: methylenetetrahydrofolate--tRNA-(uracil(54)-C(5))-methyltransferase (FADH(2)-oxidizing) TrmFO [Myxococcales bacterium]|nr:methylenetetrahydrofolate--tRNA-(uracil(54)-C(5))-methyltransferase (FADH(2)-oxidizing) TrmFO [Myxococcales bacterium]